jgi:hypothetical protein
VKKCVVGAGPSADGWPPGGPPLGPLDPYHSERRFDSARGPERQPQGREESLSASIGLRVRFARAAPPRDLRKGSACAQVGRNLVRAALPPDLRKGFAFPEANSITNFCSNRGCASADPPPWSQSVKIGPVFSSPP